MPTIVVIDPANVTVDGEPAGSFIDVLINHDPDLRLGLEPTDAKGVRGGLLAAMTAWSEARRQDATANTKAISDAYAAALAGKDAAHAAEVAELEATIAEQQALIDTLGGTELGRQMAKDAQKAALLAKQAELAEELAALEMTSPTPTS